MEHSSLGQSWRRWAAIFIGAGTLAVGACSSPNTGSWFGTAASLTDGSRTIRLTTPTFTWYPINYKGSLNEVGGVNNERELVGVYREAGNYKSFTAACPLTTSKKYINCSSPVYTAVPPYTGAVGTYLYANTTTNPLSYDAGYVIFSQPHTTTSHFQCLTCGAIYVENGTKPGWIRLLVDPSQAQTGPCAVTELLGINGAKVVVGFYEKGKGTTANPCTMYAFEEYILNNNPNDPKFVDFNVQDGTSSTVVSSVATGIDNGGNVVGYATLKSGEVEGWYYHDNEYSPFYVADSSANSTYPAGINWDGAIVGSYVNGSITHGFFAELNNHQVKGASYSTIDYGAQTDTVLNGIAPAHDWVSGWYRADATSGGAIQGLVGNCTSC